VLFNKGELEGLLEGLSSWCRVWRIELDNEFTWIEAFDFVPEFTLGGLSGSEPCIFIDDCACW